MMFSKFFKNKKIFFLSVMLAIILLSISIFVFPKTSVVKYIAEYQNRKAALEELGDWQLNMLMYDSTINDGRTQMVEDTWNATTNETRFLTVQVNFKNDNVNRTYNPGELKLTVDNLGTAYPTNSTGTSFAQVTSISADLKSAKEKKYDWSYTYDSTNNKYILTNNYTIEENSNCEGTIQLAYRFDAQYLRTGSKIELTAFLNDVLESANKVKFNFTSTEKTATMTKNAYKINSYDGLGKNADNYIWVKYYIKFNNVSEGVRGEVYDWYIEENLQEGCIIWDPNEKFVKVDKEEKYRYSFGGYDSRKKVYKYSNGGYGGEAYYYIGYPKDMYAGTKVMSSTSWVGKIKESYYYNGSSEEKLFASATKEINLDNFTFSYTGNLYSINLDTYSNSDYQTYNRLINSNYGEDIQYYVYGTIRYTGENFTARLADDLFYITDKDSNYRKITEEEYYFKNISIDPEKFRNANDVRLQYDKYNMALFVKYKNTNEYVQYGDAFSNSSGSKTITFSEAEKIVAWYLEIYDLEESIIIKSDSNGLNTKVHIDIKNDISEEGYIYNFANLQIFSKNEEGEKELLNKVGLDSYKSDYTKLNISEHDLEEYGYYIQRALRKTSYGVEKIDISTVTHINGSSQDNQFFYRNFGYEYYFYGSYGPTSVNEFNGYRRYVIIPEGAEINGTERDIIDSCYINSGYDKLLKQDGTTFTKEEYKQFIKDHTRVNIHKNYKNMGKTCVEIIVDYSDSPLNTYNTAYGNCGLEKFSIPIRIPYESYFTYGANYEIENYVMFLNEEELYLPYSKTTDTNDIDNDGNTKDFYVSSGSYTTRIVPAVSSYQEVNKSVWTENSENEWLSDIANVRYGGQYKYKLRVRTGANSITNLVIYDNLETEGGWKGTFEGVDLTFTRGQGYTPTVYYSTSSTAGKIEENPGAWSVYTDAVDKSTVKSLAFDYRGNVISSGNLTYVIVNMRAPEVVETKEVGKNKCYTTWNAIDMFGNVIDGVIGIDSNVVQLAIPNTTNELTVYKVWEDNENILGLRPESINVTLLRNGARYETVELNEATGWKYVFDVPICDESGHRYEYTVEEQNINLYSSKIEKTDLENEDGVVEKSYTITNTLNDGGLYIDICGSKKWNDDENERNRRPSNLTINLLRDGEKISSVETNASKGWTYNFDNNLVWKNNTEKYNYTISEDENQYYAPEVEIKESSGDTLGKGLKIKFNSQCNTESVTWDYVEIYYILNGITYKAGKWGGSGLTDKEVIIPTKDFYLYWRTDTSGCNYYGFKIDSIESFDCSDTPGQIDATIPEIEVEEIRGSVYPESEHTYKDNTTKLWHYKADYKVIDITNTYKKIPASVLVHHYKEGTTEKVSDDVEITGIAWDEYTTSAATDIPEYYELARTPDNATGEFAEEQIEVIYEYKYKKYDYTVEYYYDGVKDDSKTATIEATYADVINTYEDKNITGYRLMTTEEGAAAGIAGLVDGTVGKPLTITENEATNLIKVYYVKDQFNYTVEYYYDGVKDESKTTTIEATYQDIINTYENKNITGYRLMTTEEGATAGIAGLVDGVVGKPLTITENEATNLIKVYYVKDQFNYTVEYYYDGVKDESKTTTIEATYQDIINTYADKNITGYRLMTTEEGATAGIAGMTDGVVGIPLTITENESTNLIKVYYVKDQFSYTVEYYYDGTKDESKTATIGATYKDIISTYADKNITGYRLMTTEEGTAAGIAGLVDGVVGKPLTITENEATNLIKVYYVKDQFNYTVEYYYDGTKDESKTDIIEATYQDIINTYTDKNITGYRLMTTEEGTAAGIAGLVDGTVGKPLTITENESTNLIKVYYVKDQFSYTVEYYYDGTKDESKTATIGATYKDIISTYADKNITGYRLMTTEEGTAAGIAGLTNGVVGLPLTVSEVAENNVIKVYYVKDQFNYTVEYYYDGVKDESKTDIIEATYQDIINTYADKNITGYRLMTTEEGTAAGIEGLVDGTVGKPLTITENESTNLIKVYYVKDQFNYTVEYYYDGTKDDSKTATIGATYKDIISTYTDKNITGYRLMTTEEGSSAGIVGLVNGVVGLPLTISEVAGNNVIKVYYVKDQFNYTVEYYYDGVKDESKTDTIEATYKDIINTYADKNITGYRLMTTEEGVTAGITGLTNGVVGLPLTVSEVAENNVIKVYYVKDQFNYTVEYYYDGTKDDSKTSTIEATYQDIINTYDNKNITGYRLMTTEEGATAGIAGLTNGVVGIPLTITENEATNLIKVYYVKDQFSYTVEYYYDNVKDETKTETIGATYKDIINAYTDKNITGYRLMTTEEGSSAGIAGLTNGVVGLPLTVSEVAENNVIKVYYVKDQFNYTVEYYYDGTKDDSKTATIGATYKDIISTYADKNITGYRLMTTEEGSSAGIAGLTNGVVGLPLTVSEVAGNNVIKVYYVKDQFNYTVEYYYDGVKDESKTATIEATYKDVINTYADKNITGYRLMTTEEGTTAGIAGMTDGVVGLPLTITENESTNLIKVYYVKDQFNYTVEYYYDGVKDESKTDTIEATYKDVINTYADKNITGYRLMTTEEGIASGITGLVDGTVGKPLTITENESTNLIKVYYVKDQFNYTVEYYYDGTKDESKTATIGATYQDVINTYADKNITGYRLMTTEEGTAAGIEGLTDGVVGLPLTVSEIAGNNVIKVYYVKDQFNYTVEYYYDNVKDESKTDTIEATYKDIINAYADKNITGYRLMTTEEGSTAGITGLTNGVVGLPLTVSEVAENNVIKVYYVKDQFTYTIEYYYDGTKDDSKTATIEATYKDIINTYADKNITGYRLMTTEEGTAAEIEGLTDGVVGLPLTITENESTNLIKVYYVKDQFNYTVEYYYDGTKDDSKTETIEATYKDVINTYADKNITGYRLMTTEEGTAAGITGLTNGVVGMPLTVIENEATNLIKVYYVKNQFTYTVEYYYDGVKDESKTSTIGATYKDVINTYEDKNIPGYRLMTTEEGSSAEIAGLTNGVVGMPLTISEVAENNVIKVYYVKDQFNYTVEYYYEGVKDESKTETIEATYKDVINTYADKNIRGHRLMTTEEGETAGIAGLTDGVVGLPLTVTENENTNLIKVYYVKKQIDYTIEYYYENEKDDNKTETLKGSFESVIETYKDKVITGYKLDKVENLPLTLEENSENNIIKVYYVKDQFDYTVEYYYDGVKDESKTSVLKATYQDVINTYEDKNITGYKLDGTDNLPLTISALPATNVIKVYYAKDKFRYTVKYYYDGEIDDSKTETGYATYGDEIATYKDKEIYGFKFEKTAYLPLTITEDSSENVIKIYYVRKEAEIELKYMDKVTGEEISKDVIKNGKVFDEYDVSEEYVEIPGYTLVEIPEKPTGVYTEELQTKNFYYARNAMVVINYLEKDDTPDDDTDNVVLAEKDIIEGYDGKEYAATPKDIDGYTCVGSTDNTTGKMTVEPVIEVTYYYLQNTKVIVNHIDKNTDEKLDVVVENGKVGDVYTSKPKDFDNYVLVESPEEETVVMTKEDITLNYYYVQISAGVIEKHIDFRTQEILAEKLYEGNEGDAYTTAQKEFEGYDIVNNLQYYTEYIVEHPEILEENEVETVEELLEKLELNKEEPYIPENFEGVMEVELIEVKYYYVRKTSVVVKYVDKVTGKEIPEIVKDTETDSTEIFEGHEGDTYKTKEKEFDGYDIVEVPENQEGTMKVYRNEDGTIKTETEVTYYYVHKAEVIERHIDIKTEKLFEETKYEGHEGDLYKTEEKEFDGYDLVKEQYPENSEGTMTAETIIVNYYYIRKMSVRVEYIDRQTNEKLFDKIEVPNDNSDEKIYTEKDSTEHIYGYEGDSYKTVEKSFEGYGIVEDMYPENHEGIMEIITDDDGNIETEIVVKYYYARISAGVIEKHIDAINGELLEKETIYEGLEGDEYKTSSKEFESFELVKEKLPKNAEGTMTVEPIEVKYYYIRKVTVIVEHLEIGTGKKLAEDEIINGYEGDRYYTHSKKINGFNLLTNKVPENKDGVMKKQDILVTYYYESDAVKVQTPPPAEPTPQPAPAPAPQPQPTNPTPSPTAPVVQNKVQTSNNKVVTSNTNNTVTNTTKTTPDTGDRVPVFTTVTIMLVIISNICITVFDRKKIKFIK